MNASYAFRSHLMHQFISQARTQARPPLALVGLLNDDGSGNNATAAAHPRPQPPVAGFPEVDNSVWRLSSIEDSSNRNCVNLRRRHTDSDIFSSSRNNRSVLPIHRDLSAPAPSEDSQRQQQQQQDDSSNDGVLEGSLNLGLAFQTLLQSRRSTNRFAPLTSPIPIYEEQDFWHQATERAVLCGYQAPNHKRTEPFTFVRMIAPSERTERLAQIAYQVYMQKPSAKEETALRKLQNWSTTPAFLVAKIQEDELLIENNDLDSLNEYGQLPYVPPKTERALEDYASACAAVQNVLLSLHAEGLAGKWVTGSVIRTPAFRELIQANDNDRIVGLIMVGQAAGATTTTPVATHRVRRNRRPLRSGSANDVLVDL